MPDQKWNPIKTFCLCVIVVVGVLGIMVISTTATVPFFGVRVAKACRKRPSQNPSAVFEEKKSGRRETRGVQRRRFFIRRRRLVKQKRTAGGCFVSRCRFWHHSNIESQPTSLTPVEPLSKLPIWHRPKPSGGAADEWIQMVTPQIIIPEEEDEDIGMPPPP
ncbi:MAG: hypothetical protein JRJ48_06720 [Deltaproteobacteria bacterium]|nr:hypothetical protein [Deltaproteobacteria bacterium]